MADFTINFAAAASANPYTPANVTIQIGSFQNTNGSGIKPVTNGTANQAVHSAAYGSSIRSDVTVGAMSNTDFIGVAIISRSGVNANKGYVAYSDGTGGHIATLDGSGGTTDITGLGYAHTTIAGDVYSLLYNSTTGAIQCLINGTSAASGTDSTYVGDSTLSAGWFMAPFNVNGSVLSSFSGTGVNVGTTITPGVGSETVGGNQPSLTRANNTVIQPFVAWHDIAIVLANRRARTTLKKFFIPTRRAA